MMLVTGAAGFMGSHVAEELVRRGHEVLAVDDLSGGYRDNVPPQALFIEGDVTDDHFVKDLFKRYPIDYVFHLAAYAAEGLSHFIRRFNYTNNLLASVNLINASVRAKVKCFVFTSSIAVYGDQTPPFDESLPPKPMDPYGIAKYAVEMDLAAAHAMWGLPYIIFRPHNVYGERQNIADKYRNVIGIFMNNILKGEPLPIFGDGEQTRAFTHIDDVDYVIAESIFNPQAYQQVINVGADEYHSINELARIVMEEMGQEVPLRYWPARHEAVHAHCRHEKLKQLFAWRPRIDLREGVRRMSRWVKRVGSRRTKDFDHIEIEDNLPESWRQSVAVE